MGGSMDRRLPEPIGPMSSHQLLPVKIKHVFSPYRSAQREPFECVSCGLGLLLRYAVPPAAPWPSECRSAKRHLGCRACARFATSINTQLAAHQT